MRAVMAALTAGLPPVEMEALRSANQKAFSGDPQAAIEAATGFLQLGGSGVMHATEAATLAEVWARRGCRELNIPSIYALVGALYVQETRDFWLDDEDGVAAKEAEILSLLDEAANVGGAEADGLLLEIGSLISERGHRRLRGEA